MERNIKTLKNGLRVINFNSPHQFTFDDKTVLEAVSSDFAKATMLSSEDVETDNGKFISVKKVFTMSDACMSALVDACSEDVDVVIVPLPVLLLLEEPKLRGNRIFGELTMGEFKIIKSKCATCIMVDRINKIVSSTKFGQ